CWRSRTSTGKRSLMASCMSTAQLSSAGGCRLPPTVIPHAAGRPAILAVTAAGGERLAAERALVTLIRFSKRYTIRLRNGWGQGDNLPVMQFEGCQRRQHLLGCGHDYDERPRLIRCEAGLGDVRQLLRGLAVDGNLGLGNLRGYLSLCDLPQFGASF